MMLYKFILSNIAICIEVNDVKSLGRKIAIGKTDFNVVNILFKCFSVLDPEHQNLTTVCITLTFTDVLIIYGIVRSSVSN